MVEPLTREQLLTETVCSVEQAGATLGYGSARAAYRAAAEGHIPTIRVGSRRKIVPVPKLADLLGVRADEPVA